MKTLTKGEWLHDVDLKSLNTWRIGGKAERFYWPHDLEDLQRFLKTLPPEEPITWLGLGSNVLIRDGGIRGTVILTQGALRELKLLDHGLVRAEAGVASSQVARFAARSGLVGAEFLAGIPGSVGGALVMNAGACGGETWRHVHHVETIDRQGNIHKRYPSDFRIAYRTAEGLRDGEGFVAAIFKF
ncbi:MAG: FAD-binding protein, partial [Gammaproteobacteria bacterium]|nr:FAD-binding protein [Gammaproteobacteria bacterium]